MTKLFLVRHAEAEGNLVRKFHGWTDSNLTHRGVKQAEAVSKRLKNDQIDIIYSSDLKRAYTTAKHIADAKNMEVNILNELREINGGEWEDVAFDQLGEKWPEQAYNLNNKLHLLCPPGGESVRELRERIIKVVDEIIISNPGKTICIVTHGTVIKVLMCYFYAKPLEEIESIIWGDNTCVSIIEIDEDGYKVLLDSDNTHLTEEMSTLASQSWWKK